VKLGRDKRLKDRQAEQGQSFGLLVSYVMADRNREEVLLSASFFYLLTRAANVHLCVNKQHLKRLDVF